jgi:hypothetical protein
MLPAVPLLGFTFLILIGVLRLPRIDPIIALVACAYLICLAAAQRRTVAPAIPLLVFAILILIGVLSLPRIDPIITVAAFAYLIYWTALIRDAVQLLKSALYKRKVVATEFQEVLRQDRAAREVVSASDNGIPFVLYLRNFDIEAYSRVSWKRERGGREPELVTVLHRQSRVETHLAALAARVPIIAVLNPSNPVALRNVIPRLWLQPGDLVDRTNRLPSGDWEPKLKRLIDCAALVVVDVQKVSDGLEFELDAITELHAEERTAVIVPAEVESIDEELVKPLAEYARIKTPTFPSGTDINRWLSTRYPRLASRIVDADDVPFESLESSPLFRLPLRYMEFARSLTSEQRAQLRQAFSLQEQATALAAENRYDEVITYIHSALRIHDAIGNTVFYLPNAHFTIGIAYESMRRYPQAMDAYLKALGITLELGREDEGRGLLEVIHRVCSKWGYDNAINHYGSSGLSRTLQGIRVLMDARSRGEGRT